MIKSGNGGGWCDGLEGVRLSFLFGRRVSAAAKYV